jgi:hypothetical protein
MYIPKDPCILERPPDWSSPGVYSLRCDLIGWGRARASETVAAGVRALLLKPKYPYIFPKTYAYSLNGRLIGPALEYIP